MKNYQYKIIDTRMTSDEVREDLKAGWRKIELGKNYTLLEKLISETRSYYVIYGYRNSDGVWKEKNRLVDIEIKGEASASDIFNKIMNAMDNPQKHLSEFTVKIVNRL